MLGASVVVVVVSILIRSLLFAENVGKNVALVSVMTMLVSVFQAKIRMVII